MVNRQFDTLAFSQDLYRANAPSLTFNAKSREEAILWQQKLRRKVVRLLGGFPRRKCALKAEIVARETFPAYTRETVVFQSRVNVSVFGYLLLPKGRASPVPVVICLPGHGRGVDDIVGIEEDGSQRTEYGGYQRDFALQCIHHGFAALALEQFGFGHRRDERARESGAGGSSCQPASGAALLFGETMVGWRVWDVRRAVDYLRTREEVDSDRIACMGISGGGTITLFSSAIERRIKVGVVSGYFNTFGDSIMSIPHCMDNYVPGILKYAEMYDLAGLVAPRYLFAETGTEDGIFPVEATRFAFGRLRGVYDVMGVGDRVDLEVFEGEHMFHGVKAFERLGQWL